MSTRIALTFPHALGVPGGGPIHCRKLALELAAEGAEVTLVPVDGLTLSNFPRPRPAPGMKRGPFLEPLENAGIDIRPVDQHPLSWWLDGLAVRRRVDSLLRQRRFDAVIGWFAEIAYFPDLLRSRGIFFGVMGAAPYSLWWRRRHRFPAWLHRYFDQRLVARSARRADAVFANSRATRREMVDLLGVTAGRVHVVYPPVSPRFAEVRPDFSSRVERLLFWGRLTREKGILDLIDALGRLRSERWSLRVAGAGDTVAVVRLAESRGVADRVELLGPLDEVSLARELAAAQLAVLPSHQESFGLAVAEAQLAGLPVVAYDVGAVGEIAADGDTAWLVPRGRVELLAEAIGQALRRPEESRRRGQAARDRSRGLFLGRSAGREILAILHDRSRDPESG